MLQNDIIDNLSLITIVADKALIDNTFLIRVGSGLGYWETAPKEVTSISLKKYLRRFNEEVSLLKRNLQKDNFLV